MRSVSCVVVLLAAVLSASLSAQSQERPTIGLALGGGSARGLSHVGILEWLHEHRIPVDYVAGTSTGGLVGGAFATGMTPDELRALLGNVDWDLMFLGEHPTVSESSVVKKIGASFRWGSSRSQGRVPAAQRSRSRPSGRPPP